MTACMYGYDRMHDCKALSLQSRRTRCPFRELKRTIGSTKLIRGKKFFFDELESIYLRREQKTSYFQLSYRQSGWAWVNTKQCATNLERLFQCDGITITTMTAVCILLFSQWHVVPLTCSSILVNTRLGPQSASWWVLRAGGGKNGWIKFIDMFRELTRSLFARHFLKARKETVLGSILDVHRSQYKMNLDAISKTRTASVSCTSAILTLSLYPMVVFFVCATIPLRYATVSYTLMQSRLAVFMFRYADQCFSTTHQLQILYIK